MGLLKPGELTQLWTVQCIECRRVEPLDQPVTKHGARMTLENRDWAQGPRGWLCRNCRAGSSLLLRRA